jgi:DNA-binding FrmR family transcriptional regulator
MNDSKHKLLARLHRISGQVAGVGRMIEQGRPFMEVLLQIASAQAALGQVSKIVLRAHVEACVDEALASGRSERRKKIEELMEVFAGYGGLGGRSSK